jgi:hypothetical protein
MSSCVECQDIGGCVREEAGLYLLSINNPEPPVLHNSYIAGLQPAIRRYRFFRRLRITPVSETDVWAADVEFAGLAVGDFVAVIVEEHTFTVGVELADTTGAVES